MRSEEQERIARLEHQLAEAERQLAEVGLQLQSQTEACRRAEKSAAEAERRLAENERQKAAHSEALDLNQIFLTASQLGILAYRASGECVLANAAAGRIIHAEPERLLAQNFYQIPSWKRSGLLELAREALSTQEPQQGEFHFVTSFGREVWLDCSFNVFAREGEQQLLFFFADITERKQAEAELHTLARIPGENPNPVLRISADGAILYANPASRELLRIWGCGDGGSTPEFVQEIVRECLETDQAQQVELEVGSQWLEFNFAPIPENRYVNAYAADLSEQKWLLMENERQRELLERTLQEAQDSREKLIQILESIDDGFFALDRDWRFTYINRIAASAGARLPEGYLGKSIWELWPELLGTPAEEHYRWAMEKGLPAHFRIKGAIHGNLYDVSAYPSSEGISVFFFNRTESNRAEEALRRFELISAHSRDVILFMERDGGRILEANVAAMRAYGYSREELLALTIQDLRAPDTRGLTADQMAQADAGGILFETIHQRKDGSTFPVEVSSQGATIGGQRTLISVIRGITERKQIEVALRESEMFANKVLASSLNGLYLYDLNRGAITFINPRYTELTGFTLDDLGAMSGEEFLARFHPEDRSRVESQIEAVKNARNGEIFEIEYRFRNAEERWIWANSFDSVFSRNDDGTPSLQIGTFIDITDRKKAEEALLLSEERFSKAFLANPNALVISRLEDGLILDVNESFEKLYGYPCEEVIGKTSLELNLFANPSDRARAVQRMREEKALRDHEVEIRTRSGEIRQVSLSAEVLTINNETHLITIIQDITEKKRAEDSLRDYAGKLERSNHDLQEFAFIASHDLQEPLRKIQAFGESLVRTGENLDERQQDYLSRMRQAAARMGRMVDDLLALSRVTTQGKPFEPVDLSQAAAEVLSDLEMQLRRTGGKVALGDLPVVEADPFQMRQLLQNLIGNALKYHRSDVPPAVKVYAKFPQVPHKTGNLVELGGTWGNLGEQGYVEVVVEDNGIGFDESQVERIFQPFQRLVGKSQFEGSGIGLAICRKIVERHGGEITASSSRGQGATFIVRLPANQRNGQKPESTNAS